MVPNPNLKHGGWHEIKVQWPPREGTHPTHRMSVGRFTDNQYHLLGYSRIYGEGCLDKRSRILQSSGDNGIVTLPEDKDSLTKFVLGDIFSFSFHGSNYSHQVRYLGRI